MKYVLINEFKDQINELLDILNKNKIEYDFEVIGKELEKITSSMETNNSHLAIKYILQKTNLKLDDFIRIMLYKELAQIKYNINDIQDSIVDFFGWINLYIKNIKDS